jgi:nucleoside-diphosphate-sugar epimerase
MENKVFIAGHRGLVGSALVRHLSERKDIKLILRTREELDLTHQESVRRFFRDERPDTVIVTAARVGGIFANKTYMADFLYENAMIGFNIIRAAFESGTQKVINLSSSCAYPKEAPQPLSVESILTGPFEPTNEGYAIAKIACMKLCQYMNQQYGTKYISLIPADMYGPGDNFHPENSHVSAAMLRRFHEAKQKGAKEVVVWGTGKPLRELLYVDDFVRALTLIWDRYEDNAPLNVGSGIEHSIADMARLSAAVVGFTGNIVFDSSKPDGMMRKLLDSSRIRAMGWKPQWDLEQGLRTMYDWALTQGVFAEGFRR